MNTRTWVVASLLCGMGGCGGGGTGPDGDGGNLSISPTSSVMRHPQDTIRVNVSGASGAVTWSSSDPSVATVSDGLVTAAGYGRATLRAVSGRSAAAATVQVTGETSMDFLLGTWSVEDGTTPGGAVSDGFLHVATDGGAIRAVWRGTLDGAPVEVSYLAVRRGTGWSVALADGARGTFAVLDGDLTPGVGDFDAGARLGGGWRERMRFTDFTSSSVRWTVEESTDAGTTWSTRWSLMLRRSPATGMPPVLDAVSPSCSAQAHRQFDFWQGDWTVRGPSGGVAGTNLIHRVAGCGIQENWRDAGGSRGVSLNMYDPRSERWTQFYVEANGNSLELAGALNGRGEMVLSTAATPVDRVTWRLLDDGRVRQHWERVAVDGSTSTVFDGYYESR